MKVSKSEFRRWYDYAKPFMKQYWKMYGDHSFRCNEWVLRVQDRGWLRGVHLTLKRIDVDGSIETVLPKRGFKYFLRQKKKKARTDKRVAIEQQFAKWKLAKKKMDMRRRNQIPQ